MSSVDWQALESELERKLAAVSKDICKELVKEVRTRFEKEVEEEVQKRLRSNQNQNVSSNSTKGAVTQTTTHKDDPRVLLDVGGKYFATTVATLTKEPDSMLSSMFSGRFPIQKNADGRVFIDRDGSVFDIVLDYLRDGKFLVPEDPKTMEKLIREVQYYGLVGMEDILLSDWKAPKKANIVLEQPARKEEPTLFVVGENMLQYNFLSKLWTKGKPPLIDEHQYHGVVSCNNKIYVAGGNYPATNQAEMFDPETDSWTKISSMQKPRYHFGLATLDQRIYALGGVDQTSMESYDPIKNTWSVLRESFPNYSFAVATWKGNLITSGGRSNGSARVKVIQQYDPREGKWSNLGDADPIYSHQLVCVDDRIFSIGGFDGEKVLNTVKCFDMKMRQWNSVCSMKSGRSQHSAVVFNRKIIVVGGASVEEYSTDLNLWQSLPNTPESISKLGAACCWISDN